MVTRGLTVDTHAMDVKLSSPQLGEGVGRARRRRRRAMGLVDPPFRLFFANRNRRVVYFLPVGLALALDMSLALGSP